MKAFRISYPQTTSAAIDELRAVEANEEVAVMGGGQDLLGAIKDGVVTPDAIVHLRMVSQLSKLNTNLEARPSTIGAAVTLRQIVDDDELRQAHPMVVEAAESVATPQIRNQATLGGNLCQRPRCWYFRNAESVCLKKGGTECFSYAGMSKYNAILGGGPSYVVHPSDLAPALVASDATVFIAAKEDGRGANRRMPLGELFTLPAEGDVTKENTLGREEFVMSVLLPGRPGWRSTYLKVRERTSFDFALTAVACSLRMDGATVAEARLVLGGVAPTPWRCESAEALLIGKSLDEDTIAAVREEALRGAQPLEHNGYKIPMTKGLITKALRKLARA